MKILLSAYACTPGRGSEPGMGWGAATQAAKRHEVWLLTHPEGREQIEAALDRDGLRSRIHVSYIGSLETRKSFFRSRLMGWIYYDSWQRAALKTARQLHRTVRFDLAHHVTFGSWRVPTRLHALDLPVLWGPLGGGHGVPPALRPLLGTRGGLQEQVREVAQFASARDPRIRRALRECRMTLPCSTLTRQFLAGLHKEIGPPVCETAVSLSEFPESPTPGEDGPLRILWAGVHEPRKCLPLLLHALQRCPGLDSRLEVAGDGPERLRWTEFTTRLGLADRVTFLGRLSRPETLRRMSTCHIFAFSSLREATGTVLLEAMASRRPVVALNWSGAPDAVPTDAGILVSPETLEGAIEGFAAAIRRLEDPRIRETMGAAGRKSVERSGTWDAAGDRFESFYRRLAGAP